MTSLAPCLGATRLLLCAPPLRVWLPLLGGICTGPIGCIRGAALAHKAASKVQLAHGLRIQRAPVFVAVRALRALQKGAHSVSPFAVHAPSLGCRSRTPSASSAPVLTSLLQRSGPCNHCAKRLHLLQCMHCVWDAARALAPHPAPPCHHRCQSAPGPAIIAHSVFALGSACSTLECQSRIPSPSSAPRHNRCRGAPRPARGAHSIVAFCSACTVSEMPVAYYLHIQRGRIPIAPRVRPLQRREAVSAPLSGDGVASEATHMPLPTVLLEQASTSMRCRPRPCQRTLRPAIPTPFSASSLSAGLHCMRPVLASLLIKTGYHQQ